MILFLPTTDKMKEADDSLKLDVTRTVDGFTITTDMSVPVKVSFLFVSCNMLC